MIKKIILILYLCLYTNTAYAYLDPGFISSFLISIVVFFNFLVAFLFLLPKKIFSKVKRLFNKKKNKNETKNN